MARKRRNSHVKGKTPTTTIQARYDAAGNGRRLAGWVTPSSGPNLAVKGLQTIRNRTRDSIRNEWTSASQIRLLTSNMIGTGIVPRPETKDAALKKLLSDEWTKFVAVADADSVLDFYGLQVLATRAWAGDGEVFARIRPRRIEDGLPVPMQVQVLEADYVPMLDVDTWPGMPAGCIMRSGIEFDYIGRRTAFWMFRAHPGDRQPTNIAANELVRVPAEFVMHIFEPQRPGQIRGVSELATVLTKLRNIGDLDDAVLERQRLANLFTLFVTRPTPSGGDDTFTGLPFTGNPDAPVASLEPGLAQELLPGEDVKFSEPPDAGANYSDFMRTQLLGVSAAGGTPYELVSGDIKDISDRTLRIVVNEFRRLIEQKQWITFIPSFCKPIRAAWAKYAYLAGVLTEDQIEEACRVRWSPQGWAYIHPVQDVQAKQAEVDAGFRSRSSVIAERGDDPDAVDQERADDHKREEDLGLSIPPPPPVDPNADPAKKAEADKAKAETKLVNARIREVNQRSEGERMRAEADAARALAEGKAALADAKLKSAQADEAMAQAKLLIAKAESDSAEALARISESEVRAASAAEESAERVVLLQEQANLARKEADDKAQAFAAAEAFANEQRALVLDAERSRTETARLEVEAAKVGLAELQGA